MTSIPLETLERFVYLRQSFFSLEATTSASERKNLSEKKPTSLERVVIFFNFFHYIRSSSQDEAKKLIVKLAFFKTLLFLNPSRISRYGIETRWSAILRSHFLPWSHHRWISYVLAIANFSFTSHCDITIFQIFCPAGFPRFSSRKARQFFFSYNSPNVGSTSIMVRAAFLTMMTRRQKTSSASSMTLAQKKWLKKKTLWFKHQSRPWRVAASRLKKNVFGWCKKKKHGETASGAFPMSQNSHRNSSRK